MMAAALKKAEKKEKKPQSMPALLKKCEVKKSEKCEVWRVK
jgi:hypothetical protein